jgi:opine dehydrogenase
MGVEKIAVIGAGQGGCATAGHMTYKGFDVALWNRPGEKIERMKANPVLRLEGIINDHVTIPTITDDMAETLDGAQVVSLMVTGNVYDELAVRMAPHLQDGQVVVLNNAGIGGSLTFNHAVRAAGYSPDIIVSEDDVCIYGCKIPEKGMVLIKSIKDKIFFSALNPADTPTALEAVHQMYPQFVGCKDTLEVGFWNISCFHPAGMVLNADRIRNQEDFNFYCDGITPEIGKFMEEMDKERVRVAQALGLKTETACQWLNTAYGVPMGNLYEMIQANEPYKRNAPAPKTFNARMITEDVPIFLVPQLEIARALGIDQPLTQEITKKACELAERNFFTEGRTLGKLGLTEDDIRSYRQEGLSPYIERNGLARGKTTPPI